MGGKGPRNGYLAMGCVREHRNVQEQVNAS